jgi:uncharacterized protein YecE (DUF72 family)
MKKYLQKFKLAEVQSTFYKLPKVETALKWRSDAEEDFEFTVKAWQAITHPPTSPTWKKAGIIPSTEKMDKYGFLKPTEEVFEAWKKTKEICHALKAEICLIQCPASFNADEQNIRNMKEFFSEIDRGNLTIAWEPRGESWTDEKVRRLCEELDLTHCVDPFAQQPVHFSNKTAYFRLHGKPPGAKMYYYRYSDKDLEWLSAKLRDLEAQGLRIYCLFNNVYMGEDAERFAQLIGQ